MPMNAKAHRTEEDLEFDTRVGERIRALRRAVGMTQTDLARLAGVTFQQVQKYERGVNRVAASRLSSIAAAMGVRPSELLGEVPENGPTLLAGQKRLLALYATASPTVQKLVVSYLQASS